ncbi:hypothetical protein PGT21_014604 [Puccinia graminis f. sp. tritici]|uniref:Uncharacterized protein n=1 Tax=Puccinia graminis f. sp. tritici TaxID=56615 RepID=A0A5B0M064_PUCGR|nr:hypothetical protein PGT21_014604 [Puccinia graminis f. sp. tritici]KAA1089890.1 hypothetical protein PGTUg99_027025 [Puccinia graminis f. sp. tritici]
MHYSYLQLATCIICSLQVYKLHATGTVNEPGFVGTDLERSFVEETTTATINTAQRLPNKENASKTPKQSLQDTISASSSQSLLEAFHLENKTSTKGKQPRMKTELEKITEEHYKNTMLNFDDWSSIFFKLKLPKVENSAVEKKMEEVKNAISNLFQKRITELRGQPYEFKTTKSIISGDFAASITVRWVDMWLRSVSDIEKTWELTELNNKEEAIPFIRHGIDLMIDFFIDLHKLEIVPKELLSDFLNKEGGSKIISSYAYNRFCQPRLDVGNLYMNFNVKLSLLECPFTEKMSALLKTLDDFTWKQIELDYLKAQFMAYSKDPTQTHCDTNTPSIEYIFNEFLELESSKAMGEISVERVRDLINDSMNYLKKEINVDDAYRFPIESKSLIETKLIYDMISFILRYHQGISDEIEKHNQGTRFYIDICAIEASVGLLSSVYHSIYVRAKEYQNRLDPIPWKADFLVDKNENRNISLFSVKKNEVSEISYLFDQDLKPRLPELYENKSVQLSIQKAKYQMSRWHYLFDKVLNSNPPEDLDHQFLALLRHYPTAYTIILNQFEKLFQERLSRETLNERMRNIKFYAASKTN